MSIRYRASLASAVLAALVVPVAFLATARAAGAQAPAPAAASGDTITFADALARMRASHETLQAVDRERAQKEEERKATRSLYWPTAEAGANYTRIDRSIEIDLNEIRTVILTLHPQVPSAMVPSFVDHMLDKSFWRADVQATWPVFTGGRITAANRAAEAQVRDVDQERRLTENSLSSELVKRYFGLRLALNARDVRARVLAGLEQHVHDATRLEEEGLISRAERLHAEVARSEAFRELKKAEQDTEIARAGLANILSQEHAADPATPLFLVSTLDPMDRFQQRAQEKHPAFGRLSAQQDLAGQALRAQRGRWFPEVYLFGRRELHTDDLTVLDPKWAAGVGGNITLFDGFDRSHRIAAARLQQQRVSDLERRTRRDIATLVEKRYRELSKAREQFDALKSALELGQENLRVRTRAFEEGLGTSLDVVDARLSLSRVELERLAAAYDFDVALGDLLEASGESEKFTEFATAGMPVQDVPPAPDGR